MTKNSLLIIMLLGTFTASFSPSSNALGWFGHHTVCQLAYEALSTNKRDIIDSLLTSMPQEQQNMLNKYSRKNRGAKITFAQSCTWADVVKNQPNYKQYKSWHYINVDRNATMVDKSSCSKNCITKAIDIHKQQLVNAKDTWKKTQALMFLSHWLGDIHQPLHVSFASDLGGNKVKIKPLEGQRCSNLHWLWDDCLIKQSYKKPQELVTKLSKKWQSAPLSDWQETDQYNWANESLVMLRQSKFGYCEVDNNGVCQAPNSLPVVLASDYYRQYSPKLETRVLQAAVRLQHLLDEAL